MELVEQINPSYSTDLINTSKVDFSKRAETFQKHFEPSFFLH